MNVLIVRIEELRRSELSSPIRLPRSILLIIDEAVLNQQLALKQFSIIKLQDIGFSSINNYINCKYPPTRNNQFSISGPIEKSKLSFQYFLRIVQRETNAVQEAAKEDVIMGSDNNNSVIRYAQPIKDTMQQLKSAALKVSRQDLRTGVGERQQKRYQAKANADLPSNLAMYITLYKIRGRGVASRFDGLRPIETRYYSIN